MPGVKKIFSHILYRPIAKFALVLIIIAGLYSCKRDIPKRELLSNYEANSFSELFEVFWKGMNSNYVFWDMEKTNWDSVYHAYKPKFDSLDLRPYSDTVMNACFQYMADMTKGLKDGQYALALWNGGDYHFEDSLYQSYISFIPKLLRTQKTRAALPDTLFDYIIQYNYLRNFDYGIYRNYNTGDIFQIITGNISKGAKNIIYTSLNTCMMKESYDAGYASRPPRPVIKNLFDAIHKSNCDGIIIDLRNNRGGNLEDVDFFAGQFTSKPILFGYARYKSGPGRLDYSPPLPLIINPQPGTADFKKPIVILTDRYTAALTETMVLAFKGLPDTEVTVIGERSYGTAGMIAGNDIATNGGSFSMGAFGSTHISNTALMDKNHHFNFDGIIPDIEVNYDAASISLLLRSGFDIQLEKTISYLNK